MAALGGRESRRRRACRNYWNARAVQPAKLGAFRRHASSPARQRSVFRNAMISAIVESRPIARTWRSSRKCQTATANKASSADQDRQGQKADNSRALAARQHAVPLQTWTTGPSPFSRPVPAQRSVGTVAPGQNFRRSSPVRTRSRLQGCRRSGRRRSAQPAAGRQCRLSLPGCRHRRTRHCVLAVDGSIWGCRRCNQVRYS